MLQRSTTQKFIILLAITGVTTSSCYSEEIANGMRVQVISSHAFLINDKSQESIPISFGALLKINRVEKSRCLAYDNLHEGWIDKSNILSLSDSSLLPTIQRASVSGAEQACALGNYYLHRNQVTARSHYEKAVQLDDSYVPAVVGLLNLYETVGDVSGAERTLELLKRFPAETPRVLSRTMHASMSTEDFKQCYEAAQSSPFLKSKLAALLVERKIPELLPLAHRLAVAASQEQPLIPTRSRVAGQVYRAMMETADTVELREELFNAALAFTLESARRDHTFWFAYNEAAQLFQMRGESAKAIRLAQNAIACNPRAITPMEIIVSYLPALERGTVIEDARGTAITLEEVSHLAEVVRGLRSIGDLDLPMTDHCHPEDEWLRLHGNTMSHGGLERDKLKRTALHVLVEEANPACIAYLNRHFKLDWSVQNAHGQTPLHQAVAQNNVVLIWALINCGADFRVKDGLGTSALIASADSPLILHQLTRAHPPLDKESREALSARLGLKRPGEEGHIEALIKERALNSLRSYSNEIIVPTANNYRSVLSRINNLREQQNIQTTYIPRDNTPVLVYSELDLDAKYYPTRAHVRLMNRIQDETQEKVDRHLANVEQAAATIEQLQRSAQQTFSQVQTKADTIVSMAWMVLDASEFEDYFSRDVQDLIRQLAACGINWSAEKPVDKK